MNELILAIMITYFILSVPLFQVLRDLINRWYNATH